MSKRGQYEENLKKGKRFSKENQPSPEAKSKGKQAKKTMREILDYLLEKEITNKKGEKATTKEAILVAAIKKAIEGDIKALQFIRDTVGEMPVVKQEVSGINGVSVVVNRQAVQVESNN
jgi:hypothetical protein